MTLLMAELKREVTILIAIRSHVNQKVLGIKLIPRCPACGITARRRVIAIRTKESGLFRIREIGDDNLFADSPAEYAILQSEHDFDTFV
jgi:hypothetical protein